MGERDSQQNIFNILCASFNSSLDIYGDGRNRISLEDPALPKGERTRTGYYFVSMPLELVQVLPGSVVTPEQFLSALNVKNGKDYAIGKLLGQSVGTEENPAFSFQEENFSFRVVHGSTNPDALNNSQLAALGFDDPEKRQQYQINLSNIIAPVIQRDSPYQSPYQYRIIEDCIASGDTIAGVLAVLAKEKPINGIVRIDVAAATAQGILVLKEYAKKRNLKLEINVGYLAYGLSQGETTNGIRKHANYITYPPEIIQRLSGDIPPIQLEQYQNRDGNIYVVGDMGDAAKRVQTEWDKLRKDIHEEGYYTDLIPEEPHDEEKPTILFFANGGYLMQAYFRHFCPQSRSLVNERIFLAKRVWAEAPHGYGVLIDEE